MKFLLINPYICDFACYDYWLKPLGLLYLSSLLKNRGHKVELLDCMDRHHRILPENKDKKYGTGRFISKRISTPDVFKKFPRYYSIYGLYGKILYNLLEHIKKPDMVILTSSMTYWYPGVKYVAMMLKEIFPEVPIVLGGIYATLCENHARNNIPADYVITGSDFKEFFNLIGEEVEEFDQWPAPDYSHYRKLPYIVIRTSTGCPKNCSFCGVKTISGKFKKKSAEKIKDEIDFLNRKYRVKDVVFYDDSLMENKGFNEYLENAPGGLRFHTPNGIEVKRINKETAFLLRKANFIDPCLSIDIVDEDRMRHSGNKLKKADIEQAVQDLFNAGFKKGDVSAYLIMGLPGQSLREIKKSIKYAHDLGLKVRLAEYAVVPGTPDSDVFSEEVINEPLLHNNSIFPAFPVDEWNEIYKVKDYAMRLNLAL